MSEAERLNAVIQAQAPAAAALLSGLGRRMWFPNGVPAQARDARNCAINATIGQVTDGAGGAVPLPVMADATSALPPESVFLYSPQGGNRALRQRWREQLLARAPTRAGLPMITCGLTHGLSLLGDLFIDEGTEVLLPDPCWGNYRLLFAARRAGTVRSYNVVTEGGFDLDSLRTQLQRCTGPAVLVLNLPSNPVGYSPTLAEADALVELIAASPVPLVVFCDDAYHGMVWEEGLLPHSLFHRLSHLDPARVLAVKIDGATKELFFFGGRVGFVTVGIEGEAADALDAKLLGLARSSVSTVSTASQALVLRALQSAELEAQRTALLARLEARYRRFKSGLDAAGLSYQPFNSAFFALIRVQGAPHDVRRAMLADGVGVVAVPAAGAVRVSYASVADDQIDGLVAALARHAR